MSRRFWNPRSNEHHAATGEHYSAKLIGQEGALKTVAKPTTNMEKRKNDFLTLNVVVGDLVEFPKGTVRKFLDLTPEYTMILEGLESIPVSPEKVKKWEGDKKIDDEKLSALT